MSGTAQTSNFDRLLGRSMEDLETPFLAVDLDRLERNLSLQAEYAREHRLGVWPHTKTHKSLVLARRQLGWGAEGLTVAKTGEAEVMARAGCRRLLVAYPVWGEGKWRRLAELAADAEVTVAVDSAAVAEGLSAAARARGVTLRILVDIDVGFQRTGVPGPEAALFLAQRIGRLRALSVDGLFFYPGHVRSAPAEQTTALAAISAVIDGAIALFDRSGICRERVSGGSTPTGRTSHLIAGQTETRPGTYLFNDRNCADLGVCDWSECALTVVSSVVSTSVPGKAIIDAGSKTMSGDPLESGDRRDFGWIVGRSPAARLVELSEEHGHIALDPEAAPLRVGDRVRVVPNHVCPAVNLQDAYVGIRAGRVEEVFTADARGCVQ